MVIETESPQQRYVVWLDPTKLDAKTPELVKQEPVLTQTVNSPRWLREMELIRIHDQLFGIVETDTPQSLYDYPVVRLIEPDRTITIQGCQKQAPWHLWRPTYYQRPNNPSTTLSYNDRQLGQSVHIYIVDTWADVKHDEFEGRLEQGGVFATGQHTHGTHVAGLALGKTFGYAKEARGSAVQVMDSQGQGSYSTILRGLGWVSDDAKRNGRRKAVVNLSLGGIYSTVFNRAVEALDRQGLHVFAAAGNEGKDACLTSPGSARVSVVGATDVQDMFASFSNRGRCVTILAPGSGILSALPNQQTGWMSGTSMATPIVSGLAACHLSSLDYTPAELRQKLRRDGANGLIHNVPQLTRNTLIQHPFRGTCKQQ